MSDPQDRTEGSSGDQDRNFVIMWRWLCPSRERTPRRPRWCPGRSGNLSVVRTVKSFRVPTPLVVRVQSSPYFSTIGNQVWGIGGGPCLRFLFDVNTHFHSRWCMYPHRNVYVGNTPVFGSKGGWRGSPHVSTILSCRSQPGFSYWRDPCTLPVTVFIRVWSGPVKIMW